MSDLSEIGLNGLKTLWAVERIEKKLDALLEPKARQVPAEETCGLKRVSDGAICTLPSGHDGNHIPAETPASSASGVEKGGLVEKVARAIDQAGHKDWDRARAALSVAEAALLSPATDDEMADALGPGVHARWTSSDIDYAKGVVNAVLAARRNGAAS